MKVNNNYDDFYWNLPEDERLIFDKLKSIIENTLPHVRIKMALGVPFFYLNYRLCFIWPASVPWGGNIQGVAFGVCNGYLMDTYKHLLKFETRKQVGSLDFESWQVINEEDIRLILMEAEEIDYKLKARKNKH